ncbi:hypothetical protein AMECASPLE_039011 [Ameca splendens]|uniref:Uncharacterized protein n=1 Tax=Ameca splendens TaxID=208324 RepID=A0ABV0XLG0_9TELE
MFPLFHSAMCEKIDWEDKGRLEVGTEINDQVITVSDSSGATGQWVGGPNPRSVCLSRRVLGQDTSPALHADGWPEGSAVWIVWQSHFCQLWLQFSLPLSVYECVFINVCS